MAAEKDFDTMIRTLFFPDPSAKGVIVEVGAAGPSYLSTSESFRTWGWRVIAIEPNPMFCAQHRAAGYEVLEYACSDHDADDVPFTVVDSNNTPYRGGQVSFEAFSSLGLPPKLEERYEAFKTEWNMQLQRFTINVKVRRLDRILAEHAPDVTGIDIVAVDVEGWELAVLRGLSFDRHRPKVVILENLFDDPEYRAFMQERGYWVLGFWVHNEVYARADWCAPGSRALPAR